MRQYGDRETQPVINQLRDNIEAYFSTKAFENAFFDAVFNLKTCRGFGLDIWGRIVAQERFLKIEANVETLGFDEGDGNGDWYPFDDGTWFDGEGVTENYRLSDEMYRLLILMKAFANISQTTIPNLNKILMNIFGDRGQVYVVDTGNMEIKIAFGFQILPYEKAIMNSGAIPHPGGVKVTMQYLNPDDFFGFEGSGFQPLNQAPFFNQTKQETDR